MGGIMVVWVDEFIRMGAWLGGWTCICWMYGWVDKCIVGVHMLEIEWRNNNAGSLSLPGIF